MADEQQVWAAFRALISTSRENVIDVNRHAEELSLFLFEHPHLCKERDEDNLLPLHRAVKSMAPIQIVQILAESFADALPDTGGALHETPLHMAVARTDEGEGTPEANLEVIRYLAEQYPQALTVTDKDGLAPLHRACIEDLVHSLPVVTFLVQTYPESAQVCNEFGSTLLHLLLKCARQPDPEELLEVTTLLLERYPESVRTVNDFGRTPLHLACVDTNDDHLPVIKLLVEAYPEALKIRDTDKAVKETPLHAACREGSVFNTQIIEYLVQKCPAVLEEQDKPPLGTPLHELCMTRAYDTESLVETMRLLSISKAAVTVTNGRDWTPIQCAAFAGNVTPETWHLLVEAHPDFPIIAHGKPPLHLAVRGSRRAKSKQERMKYISTIRTLLTHQQDSARRQNNSGATPLVLACKKNVALSIVYELMRFNPVESLELLATAGSQQ